MLRRITLMLVFSLIFTLPVVRNAQAACPPVPPPNAGSGNVTNVVSNPAGQSCSDVFGGQNTGSGNTTNVIVNAGTVTHDLNGNNNTGSGSLTNNITNDGRTNGINLTVGAGDNLSTTGGTNLNVSTNNGSADKIYGGYNRSGNNGNTTNIIILNPGSTTGLVYAGQNALNSHGNMTNVVTVNGGTVTGTIDGGENFGTGTINRTLVFAQTITDDGEWARLKALLPTLLPSHGTVTINGKTYTYLNFDQLLDQLKLALRVTWFDPGDGRVEPRPGDHLAAYCDIKNGLISAIIIGTGDSKGKALATFKYSDVMAAGQAGLSVNRGELGVISLSGDAAGNFWMAWNGGIYSATGQGDFAKGFSCKFAS